MSKPFTCGASTPADSGAHRPTLIGIAGGRGVGKSSVIEKLRELGANVVVTDEITHELLEKPGPAYEEVLRRFGEDLAPAKGGPIDRALLAQRAFKIPADKAALEGIVQPRIYERLREIESGYTENDKLFEEMPLLHEAGLAKRFDLIWCITAPEAARIKWVMDRDGVSEDVARFLVSQHALKQEEKAARSDVVIENNGTIEDLNAKVDAEYQAVGERVKAKRERTAQDAVDEGADERYQKLFLTLGTIGVEEAVRKLGRVAHTGHKVAEADLSMDVNSDHPDQTRKARVTVRMEMTNEPGTPPDGGCSCGCGPECRVSCACQPDCGCSCKRPVPPPPPSGGDTCKRGGRFWLVALLGLFGLIAFLAFVYAWNHPRHVDEGERKIVIINEVPPCPGTCKPKPDPDPGPYRPPAPPREPTCTSGTKSEMPEFAFRATHNAVRVQLRRWEVSYNAACKGAVVDGYDERNRLLAHQEFDKDYWMVFQYVFTYFDNGTVQVDRFEGRSNTFVGRTVYRFQGRLLLGAEQRDGMQRLLVRATYQWVDGTPAALSVETFDITSGGILGTRTIVGLDAIGTFLKETFYIYDWLE